jgi:HK97 family phage prohead protease
LLRFHVDVHAAEPSSRTITGLALPYGEVAQLNGKPYTFTPGSLRAARERTPLLLGHDPNQPVGILTGLAESEAGVVATFRVDPGQHGDQALAQAASGSRGGLSIGAEIVRASEDADGVTVVAEAALFETSLVAIPAFSGAEITAVTANHTPEKEPADMTDNPETPDTETELSTELEENNDMDQDTTEVAASRRLDIVKAASPKLPTASEFVRAQLRADRGDARAAELVRAAITPTMSTDVPGALPPVYTNQVIGLVPQLRTLASTVANRPMPASGLKIIKPKAGTLPNGAVIGYDAEAPTGKITMTSQEVDVIEWAFACDFSASIVERGTPDVIEYAYARIVEDYYLDVEKALAAELQANASGTQATVGAALAEVYAKAHRPADVIVAAPDLFGSWIDAEGMMKWSQGNVSGDMSGSLAGVRVVVSPDIAAGTAYAMASSAIELRESAPLRLTAVNVGGLRVELGVVSFYSIDTEIPEAIVAIGAAAPKPAAK